MTRFADELTSCRVPAPVARWARRGVTRATLIGPGFERTAYGFYRRAGAPSTTAQRVVDAAVGMPDGAWIAGWAAAYVHGVTTLDGLDDRTRAPLRVPVLLAPGQRRRPTAGIEYHQSTRAIRGVIVDDVPVTTVIRTTLDLALLAPDLTEAVVGLDAVLGSRLTTPEQLQRAAARLPSRRRGACQARRAIELAMMGVRSTWESQLRMFAVLELGWRDPQPNRAVFDHRQQPLGIPDLLDIDAGLAMEYDGATWRSARAAGHRDRAQHREDNEREERLERAGLIVVRADKDDLTRYRDRLADEPEGWLGLPA